MSRGAVTCFGVSINLHLVPQFSEGDLDIFFSLSAKKCRLEQRRAQQCRPEQRETSDRCSNYLAHTSPDIAPPRAGLKEQQLQNWGTDTEWPVSGAVTVFILMKNTEYNGFAIVKCLCVCNCFLSLYQFMHQDPLSRHP